MDKTYPEQMHRTFMAVQSVGRVCYLAGPISGFRGWRLRFAVAERVLWGWGATAVLSPRALPVGLTYNQYMRICLPMVDAADVVVMLPGWQSSPGALAEYRYASSLVKWVLLWDGREEVRSELGA